MDTAKLFNNGRSQAVRLPKAYRFEGDEVLIKKIGAAVVLLPRKHTWQMLFDGLDLFEPQLKLEREQPAEQQQRKALRR